MDETITNDLEKVAADVARDAGGPVAGTVAEQVVPLVLPALIGAIETLFQHIGLPPHAPLRAVKAAIEPPAPK